MVNPAPKEQVKEKEAPSVELYPTLIRALADIVEDAEQPSVAVVAEVTPWFCFVPYPGVRYYSYQVWPPPVESMMGLGVRRAATLAISGQRSGVSFSLLGGG